jgi:drug/metabolite transporter (DMT)-like permease
VKANSLSWLYLIILSLVWGSSFILMKEGLVAFTSDEVAGLRIAIAFIALSPLLLKHWKNIHFKKDWPGLVMMGVFGNLIPAFLFTKAETQISSSVTGMLNALTPLFTILIGVSVFKAEIKKFQIIGVAIGLIGALCLMGFDDSAEQSKNINYSLLVVAATICYAISINGIKKFLPHMNSVAAAVGSFTIIGPIALAYLLFNTEFSTHMANGPGASSAFGFICILAVVGTAISIIIYNQVIKMAGIVFAASCTYLIPIVAIGWGILDGEKVSMVQLFSMGIIILGLWLINKK